MELAPIYYIYLYYKDISTEKVYFTLPTMAQEETLVENYWGDSLSIHCEVSNLANIYPHTQGTRTILHFKDPVKNKLSKVTAISYGCMTRLLQHLISIGFIQSSDIPFLYRPFASEEEKLARAKTMISIKNRFEILDMK
jgi:hypothetical protein